VKEAGLNDHLQSAHHDPIGPTVWPGNFNM
jgi:hypothetical protein